MLDFPNSPAPSEVFSDASGASWYWDGAKWSAMGTSTEGWPFLPLSGGTVTGTTIHTTTDATTPLWVGVNPVVSGSALAQSFYTNTNASGTTSKTLQPVWNMFLTTDSVNATAAESIANVANYYTCTNTQGARIAEQISLSVGPTNDPPGWMSYHQGLSVAVGAVGTIGGSSTTYGGNLFGQNIFVRATQDAKYMNSMVGLEIDLGAQAGSSVSYKVGLSLILEHSDAVESSAHPSCAIGIGVAADSPSSSGWGFGLVFGGPGGWWPINPTTGIMIYADPAHIAGGPPLTCASGVDLSAVTFSQAAFKSTGFTVDGSGHTSPLLTNATNDAAAATAGVPVGAMYRNGNAVQVRLT